MTCAFRKACNSFCSGVIRAFVTESALRMADVSAVWPLDTLRLASNSANCAGERPWPGAATTCSGRGAPCVDSSSGCQLPLTGNGEDIGCLIVNVGGKGIVYDS